MNLAEAIAKLDPSNADHWTEQGLPKLDVIKELTGEHFSRKEVTEAAPLVTREALLSGADTSIKPADYDRAAESEVKALEEPKAAAVNAADAMAHAKAALEALSKEKASAEAVFKEAKTKLADITARCDAAAERVDALQPKTSNIDEIQLWLKSQHAQRVGRAKAELPSEMDRTLKHRQRPKRSIL